MAPLLVSPILPQQRGLCAVGRLSSFARRQPSQGLCHRTSDQIGSRAHLRNCGGFPTTALRDISTSTGGRCRKTFTDSDTPIARRVPGVPLIADLNRRATIWDWLAGRVEARERCAFVSAGRSCGTSMPARMDLSDGYCNFRVTAEHHNLNRIDSR